jgi:hypothetical protein
LIVVLTLAGLGLLQSSHCDDMPVAAAMSAPGHATGPAAEAAAATPASPHHHHHEDGPAELAATVDDCRSPVTRVSAAAASGTTRPLPTTRAVSMTARPQLPPGRILPAVALNALGVSRT